jgi:hypothetical protein
MGSGTMSSGLLAAVSAALGLQAQGVRMAALLARWPVRPALQALQAPPLARC